MKAPRTDLTSRFARVIRNTGPISLAHYMAESNARYYAEADPLGDDGDFVTAPEVSQMFGELIGLWIADLWLRADRSGHFHYVELGPGRGTLARDALDAMAKFGVEPLRHFVETSPTLRAVQTELHREGRWHDGLDTLPTDAPLVIVANEFFDALPVRQLVATEDGWRERMVDWDGEKFFPRAGSRKMDAAVPDAIKDAPAGTILETCPAASGFAFEIAGRITAQGGAALMIDYGYDRPMAGSSFQAVARHERADPFVAPGTCDLTAHVNFHELAQIGRSREVMVHGPVQQGAWLKALGIDARAAALIEAEPERAAEIELARDRLTVPKQMGALFKVLAYVAPDWPEPEGF